MSNSTKRSLGLLVCISLNLSAMDELANSGYRDTVPLHQAIPEQAEQQIPDPEKIMVKTTTSQRAFRALGYISNVLLASALSGMSIAITYKTYNNKEEWPHQLMGYGNAYAWGYVAASYLDIASDNIYAALHPAYKDYLDAKESWEIAQKSCESERRKLTRCCCKKTVDRSEVLRISKECYDAQNELARVAQRDLIQLGSRAYIAQENV